MTLFETGLLALFLSAVVVKPQELPGLGRRAGRLAGRAVRRLQDMKKELGEYVDKNDMRSVQEELQQTMTQLNKIRQDVRSVSSVKGMVMDFTASPTGREKPSYDTSRIDETTSPVDNRNEGQHWDGGHKEQQNIVIPISARDLESFQDTTQTSADKPSKLAYEDDKGSASRILLDALKEERVARQALQFFDTQQQNTPKPNGD